MQSHSTLTHSTPSSPLQSFDLQVVLRRSQVRLA